ncbi:MAG: trypsin-like peptidase domain-containing protein [Phycisphaerae bacterium]|jgi:S1-C subfamily serine protease
MSWRALLLAVAVAGCVVSAAPADDLADALALVRQQEQHRVEVLAQAARSVVCIYGDRERSGGGTGVIIDSAGYGLTNFHVVADLLATRSGFGGLADGNLYPLRVIGIDPGGDLAFFKLDGRERFEPAPLGDAATLQPGQWVAALGNPFMLAEDGTPTVTLGVVSGLHRYQYGEGNLLEYADCTQVSTSINPGNSGGPLFDMAGRVVGIVGRASFEERGRVNVGLGYAITINQAKRFLPALRAGRLCYHGTLGATVQRAGDELIFNAVQALSPAERAGVELGDELLAINGDAVHTPNEFNNAIAVLPAEWPVTILVRRGDRELTLRTRLQRLVSADLPTWIPDLAQNHVEIRRLLSLYRQYDLEAAGPEPRRVQGRVRLGDAEEEVPFIVGDEAATPPGLPMLVEWQELIAPLLLGAEFNVDWQARGGDLVDGRLVAVVERRLGDDRRLRWKFDAKTNALLTMTVGREPDTESVTWTPGERFAFGEMRWPLVWQRRTAAGEETRLEVLAIETLRDAPATQPGGEP